MSTDPQQTPPEADPALESDARAHDTLPPDAGSARRADPAAQIAQLTARARRHARPLDARRGRDAERPHPRQARRRRHPAIRRAEIRRPTSSKPPRTSAAASPACPPPADDEPAIVTKLREGLEGVERSFVGILERNGIKRIDPTGQPFDANLHQAMAEQPSAEHPPGTVIQAWTQGWTLNGRLLKPAMVVVAKAADRRRRPTADADVSA